MSYRIGIDVGGTFTHAVAIESKTLALAGKTKVPTTHHAQSSVGEGVVQALSELMQKLHLQASDILFVAHSTTQATNSLLEGDVAPVGIVTLGTGLSGRLAKRAGEIGKIKLSPGKYLRTTSLHLDLRQGPDTETQAQALLDPFLADLQSQGVRVIVTASAFSVDDPTYENAIAEYVRAKGFLCTPTHEVSRLYGIKIRIRTTAINASILPKMMEVADHTEAEIRKLGITSPFMIMRSDGGVMSVEEMRRKPVLTLLSGPAAGVAAALRYLRISDGIFLEVGGTSTDISVIKNGRAITRSATIGGNKTFLKTLDVRTIGIGGGSLPRIKGARNQALSQAQNPNASAAEEADWTQQTSARGSYAPQIADVGPRSAHIAGVRYAAFDSHLLSQGTRPMTPPRPKTIRPRADDPSDYLVFYTPAHPAGNALSFAFTPTCASNLLGLVPEGDCARAEAGFSDHWRHLFLSLGGAQIEEFAHSLLNVTSERIGETVESLIDEYQLNRNWIRLIGGGGGASAIVPHLSGKLGIPYEIARDNDVISAIGVALGLVREVVERSCVQPTPDDIYRLRTEARERVAAQGVDPASIEVFIEVDLKKNIIRAEAQGSIEYKLGSAKLLQAIALLTVL